MNHSTSPTPLRRTNTPPTAHLGPSLAHITRHNVHSRVNMRRRYAAVCMSTALSVTLGFEPEARIKTRPRTCRPRAKTLDCLNWSLPPFRRRVCGSPFHMASVARVQHGRRARVRRTTLKGRPQMTALITGSQIGPLLKRLRSRSSTRKVTINPQLVCDLDTT